MQADQRQNRLLFGSLLTLALLGCGRTDGGSTEIPAAAEPPLVAKTVEAPVPQGAAGESWNAGQIAWLDYEAGMARAKAENKPVMLVFYTQWCPHCRAFSHVFDDAQVVERSREFVMIRVDADEHFDLNQRHAPDGTYIPRTFFLSSDGKVDTSIHAPRPKFLYFYDERNPASVLAGMQAALDKRVR